MKLLRQKIHLLHVNFTTSVPEKLDVKGPSSPLWFWYPKRPQSPTIGVLGPLGRALTVPKTRKSRRYFKPHEAHQVCRVRVPLTGSYKGVCKGYYKGYYKDLGYITIILGGCFFVFCSIMGSKTLF